MSWSVEGVSAADQALLALDKPILAAQALVSPTAVKWSQTAVSADATASGFPARRAYDGLTGLVTKPNAGQTSWSYVIDASGSPLTFDAIFFINTNFASLTTPTMLVYVADDSSIIQNRAAVQNVSVSGPRQAFLSLGHNAAVDPVTFTGAGLNDATSGGTFSGSVTTEYRVEIDGTGTPDTFKWSDDGGDNWNAETVAITGSAQTLSDGVTITFAATTGHTLTNRWDFNAHTTDAAPNRYVDVPYIRILLSLGASEVPEIGEVIFAKRVQLQSKPNRPYNKNLLAQSSSEHVTRTGVRTESVHFRGARHVLANCTVTSDAKITEVVDWFEATQHGTKPFVWIEDPSTAPNDFHFVKMDGDDKTLEFEEVGPVHRELRLSAIEQGPDYLELE